MQKTDEFREALRRSLPALTAAAVFSGAINLLYLSSPLYLMQVYNRVLVSGSMQTLVMITIALIIALLTMAVLDGIRSRVLVRGALRFDRLMSARVIDAMLRNAALRGTEQGAQALRAFDQFRNAMAGPSVHVLFDIPWTPLYLIVLFFLHPLLGLLATAGALALLGLAVLNEATTRKQLDSAGRAAMRNYTFTDSMVRNADIIRAMGMQRPLLARWRIDRDLTLARQAEASDVTGSLTATIRFFRLLLQGAVLGVGAWLAVDHLILPATIFAATIIMGRALSPVEGAVTAWRQFGAAGEAALRIRRLLYEQPRQRPATRLPEPDGTLALDRVSYVPDGKRVALRDITFELARGESLGVVGASAAGKSTLTRIIAGGAVPTTGDVRFGGMSLRTWHPDQVGRHIGYLPDHVGLFNGTIRDNIARFQAVSDEAVIEAAMRARIHELILSFPDGYDTELSAEGLELSGGQRQRIGLARALFGAPRLVVMDEPNAHLDTQGERALDEVVADLKEAKATAVIVTHRPNVLAVVDKLLVMNDGEVEMIGPREEVVDTLRKKIVRPVAVPA
jgi:ATP-binding cassette subfamily C exporter for protease/lipase